VLSAGFAYLTYKRHYMDNIGLWGGIMGTALGLLGAYYAFKLGVIKTIKNEIAAKSDLSDSFKKNAVKNLKHMAYALGMETVIFTALFWSLAADENSIYVPTASLTFIFFVWVTIYIFRPHYPEEE